LREMYAMTSDLKAPLGYTDDLIDSLVLACYYYLIEKPKLKFYTTWDESINRKRDE